MLDETHGLAFIVYIVGGLFNASKALVRGNVCYFLVKLIPACIPLSPSGSQIFCLRPV